MNEHLASDTRSRERFLFSLQSMHIVLITKPWWSSSFLNVPNTKPGRLFVARGSGQVKDLHCLNARGPSRRPDRERAGRRCRHSVSPPALSEEPEKSVGFVGWKAKHETP